MAYSGNSVSHFLYLCTMIEQLQRKEGDVGYYSYLYMDEPLFQYVDSVANHFWESFDPDMETEKEDGTIEYGGMMPSMVPDIFAGRYLDNKIDTSKQQIYEDATEVQDTLKAFGLDTSKFWYLCLCIKDYVEGQTVDAIVNTPTHREELKMLVERLDEMQPEIQHSHIKVTQNAKLTLKVGSKHKLEIEDGQTLTLLNVAVSEFLEKYKDTGNATLFDTAKLNINNKTSLPLIYRVYLFEKYLSWFLKPLKARKGIYASKDKNLLVSRMIWILGISDDKRYYEEYSETGDKLNFLKNNLRRYKDLKIKTHNSIYWF